MILQQSFDSALLINEKKKGIQILYKTTFEWVACNPLLDHEGQCN